MSNIKQPRIVEKTKEGIEVEVPTEKSNEYDLKGFIYIGAGQDFENPPNFYEYYFKKHKIEKR